MTCGECRYWDCAISMDLRKEATQCFLEPTPVDRAGSNPACRHFAAREADVVELREDEEIPACGNCAHWHPKLGTGEYCCAAGNTSSAHKYRHCSCWLPL